MASLLRREHIVGWRRHHIIALREQGSARVGIEGKAAVSRARTVRPDFVFKDARLAIFIDGCFWHRCDAHFKPPSNNSQYWSAKIDGNVRRDKAVSRALRTMGWAVLRIWEHELSKPTRVAKNVRRHLGKQERHPLDNTERAL